MSDEKRMRDGLGHPDEPCLPRTDGVVKASRPRCIPHRKGLVLPELISLKPET